MGTSKKMEKTSRQRMLGINPNDIKDIPDNIVNIDKAYKAAEKSVYDVFISLDHGTVDNIKKKMVDTDRRLDILVCRIGSMKKILNNVIKDL